LTQREIYQIILMGGRIPGKIRQKEEIIKKRSAIRLSLGILVALFALTGLLFGGCATMAPEKPKVMNPTGRGTVLFLDKYEFKAPVGWSLMRNLEGAILSWGL
jgi:hypothetical protein